MSRHAWLGVIAVCVGGLTFMACRAAISVRTEVVIHVPRLGDIIFGMNIDASTGRGDFRNDTDDCLLMRFQDGAGNVLGTAKVKPGNNRGVAPAGTKKAQGTPVPCEGDGDEDHLTGGGPGMRPIGWDHLHTYPVFGAPVVFDEENMNNNAVYSFLVRALTVEEAQSIAETTIAQPIGTPIDPRVTVISCFKLVVTDTSFAVVALARDPFSVFRMDVNGVVDYATLGNGAVQSQLGPELWSVEAPVAYTDIHGLDQWNDFLLRTSNAGRTETILSRLAMLHND